MENETKKEKSFWEWISDTMDTITIIVLMPPVLLMLLLAHVPSLGIPVMDAINFGLITILDTIATCIRYTN
jgi:hypothetical protein